MNKTNLAIIFFLIILVGGVMAETTMNFLTKGFADTLYCQIDGQCDIDNLTVGSLTLINGTVNFLNVTIVNYNVTGLLNVDGNITAENIFLGSADEDHTIFFYEDGSPTGEFFAWDDSSDAFELSDSLEILGTLALQQNLIARADILTTGAGDDLWLGDTTQADSSARINATGDALLDGTVNIGEDISIGSVNPKIITLDGTGNAFILNDVEIGGNTFINGTLDVRDDINFSKDGIEITNPGGVLTVRG